MSMGLDPIQSHNLSHGDFKKRKRGPGSVSEATIPNGLIFRGKCVPNYINFAGPGDYDTPNHVNGLRSVDSEKRQMPTFTMQSKTKMPYFPKLDLVS